MKKSIKIGFPIICVGIIAVTFGMMADIKNKANESDSIQNEVSHLKNEVDNSIENNNIIENDEQTDLENETYYDGNSERAILLLEDKIDDNNVYFTSEGIEEGRYIVAVRNKETTIAEKYYIVDLEKEEVEVYY